MNAALAPLLSSFLLVAAACGSSSRISRTSEGRVTATVGPAGGTLRGQGNSSLGGFELEIPAGALDRLVRLTVSVGADLTTPGTTAATVPLAISAVPPVPFLNKAATLRMAVTLSDFRDEQDLVVVNRTPLEMPLGLDSIVRAGVAADRGTLERKLKIFSAPVRSLVDMQVRLTDAPRKVMDAGRLVTLGFEALRRLTDQSVIQADQLFGEAQAADPFDPAANLLRAVTRVLVVLNDRRDSGPGLDSVGEALKAYGLDVAARSLLRRLLEQDFPGRLQVPPGAPPASAIAQLLRSRVRPALELALEDLARVSLDATILFTMPKILPFLPGDREADAADTFFFRSLLAGAIAAIDLFEDLDLEADAAFLTSPAARALSFEQLLTRMPSFGSLRSAPEKRTIRAVAEALGTFVEGFAALESEMDPQANDLVVFRRSFGPSRRDVARRNLLALRDSFLRDGPRSLLLGGVQGTLSIDLRSPFAGGRLDPRASLPRLVGFVPLARSLPDPELAGLFPGMTQDRAAGLLDFADRHSLPLAKIVADGSVSDWPKDAEALDPPDPRGDASFSRPAGLDLERVFLALSQDDLAIRFTVVDGKIGFRANQATFYLVDIDDVLARPGQGGRLRLSIRLTPSGPELQVRRNGKPIVVRGQIGIAGGDLELTVKLYDLFDPDEPVRDRRLRVRSQGLDVKSGREGTDRTRPVLIRI